MRSLTIWFTVIVMSMATAVPSAAVDDVGTRKLRAAVTVSGILGHTHVLQRIASRNAGIRAAGTPGFTASADYVTATMRAAGYAVHTQPFNFPFYRQTAPPTLTEVSPATRAIKTATVDYSGSGDVTGTLVPTKDLHYPPMPGPGSTSGCEPSDFAPASPTSPQVALVQRGVCSFGDKVANAEAAGYDAVLIFTQGKPGSDRAPSVGTPADLPVQLISFEDGASLAAATQQSPVTVRLTTSTENVPDTATGNVIAETRGGDPGKVIVVGAHLDSVDTGPGINDNGSGVATVLEIARQISALGLVPRQKIRFVFFGAEETLGRRSSASDAVGLLGSYHYVDSLTDKEFGRLYANLNFDMLGSPNYVRFVFNGHGAPGSRQIEKILTDYYAEQRLPTEPHEPTTYDGLSDYGALIDSGVPTGGLFSGADEIKTAAEAAIYGGEAAAPYDSCYHQACDTAVNLSSAALAELGDAAAHVIWTLAKSKTGLFEDGSLRTRPRPDRTPAAAG